ncbi:HNH endonuclease [Mycobacterium sp. PS03-16]|uniref:HNH endonuclease signature motif containing protein n=1 Tax=Mycobacterium sp. PS03-16 TaxID=2559611 RepID=UPI00107375E9|nr:HNH endonuclease signature motif containing protein [Mycobacterium sp. PS03-16]TFV54090.1 HNH endonuclease [Mycobacterium sp. PS03-16]
MSDSYREESKLVARRLAAVAELLGRRTWEAEAEDPDCGYMIITGRQRTSAEVAAALNLSSSAASALVAAAEALDSQLPKVAAVLARGEVDWPTVQLILSRTDLVTDRTALAALDTRVAAQAARWQSWSRARVRTLVDAEVRLLDPDAVRERQRGEDSRHFDITPLADGTAKVRGKVGAPAAVIVEATVAELVKRLCREDPRTRDQRRADALEAMAQGQRLTCRCPACAPTDPPAPAKPPAPAASVFGPVRVIVNVFAQQSTILGADQKPGYLEGFGVIDADLVRDLAHGARIRTVLAPVATLEEMRRYQPSAAVDRYVRARDLTCRFPGCDRSAQICDVDHTIPFNHVDPAAGGPTAATNLKCLCREHHRLKTFGGWRDEQLPDATVVWTSPAGRRYTTLPGAADIFPTPQRPSCAAPPPRRRNPIRQRTTRIARRRRKNRTLRPINAAYRHLTYQRRHEIDARQFRNEMRRKLIMFKGIQHSTSPLCTWVNDPFEPEDLPPDWQPPPQPDTPDQPPF